MYKRRFKYLTVIFFITLFLFKGVASLYPTLLNSGESKSISEKLFCTENEEESKSAEEKAEQETKALYLNNDCQPGVALIKFIPVIKSIQCYPVNYKQSVCISIPTPPPEIV